MVVEKDRHCDFITDLPQSIKENILMRLPLKDAARTSLLSQQWRYTWTKLPHFKLDGTLFQGSIVDQDSVFPKFVSCLINAALIHDGPISKFTLSIPGLRPSPEIDKLLFFLSEKDVEELVLQFSSGKYKLHSSFFKCLKLKHVSLYSCLFNPPLDFIGFGQLHTVKMLEVDICSEELANFVYRCSQLEHLELKISWPYNSLVIHAPRLRHFRFLSLIRTVYFKNTPLLAEIEVVYITHWTYRDYFKQGKSSFDDLFCSVPLLRSLHLDSHYMKCLVAGGVPTKPNLLAVRLDRLSLHYICLEDPTDIACLIFLIRSSPNLQELQIALRTPDGANDASGNENPTLQLLDNVVEYSNVKVDQLRKVEFLDFAGTRNQMENSKLLLSRSPRLMKMLIRAEANLSPEKNLSILKQLSRVKCSSNAEVVYE